MQIYYLILEKITSFAEEAKYDISNVPGQQIQAEYEEKRSNAWEVIEELGIIKRIVSVCAFSSLPLSTHVAHNILSPPRPAKSR